jgi:hypothetical protein
VNDDDFINDQATVASMIGLTIVGAAADRWDKTGGTQFVDLALNDGRTVRFEGWGHDWWGLYVEVKEEQP